MYADKKQIEWILFETKEKNVEIARNTTLSEASVRDLRTGRTVIEKMQLKNAASLTEYAYKLKGLDISESNLKSQLDWLVSQYESVGKEIDAETLLRKLIADHCSLVERFGIKNV